MWILSLNNHLFGVVWWSHTGLSYEDLRETVIAAKYICSCTFEETYHVRVSASNQGEEVRVCFEHRCPAWASAASTSSISSSWVASVLSPPQLRAPCTAVPSSVVSRLSSPGRRESACSGLRRTPLTHPRREPGATKADLNPAQPVSTKAEELLEAMNWTGSRLETKTETQPCGYHIKPHSQRRLHKRLHLHFYMSFPKPHVDNKTEHSMFGYLHIKIRKPNVNCNSTRQYFEKQTVLTFFALGTRGSFGFGDGLTFSFPPHASSPPARCSTTNAHLDRPRWPLRFQ